MFSLVVAIICMIFFALTLHMHLRYPTPTGIFALLVQGGCIALNLALAWPFLTGVQS